MARLTCYAIIVLLLLSVAAFSDLNDVHSYALFIKDVYNYYRTTCIVLVHSDNYVDFNETSLTYAWLRAFFQRGILTMLVSFSELSREAKKYQGYMTRPLYVVILTTRETMDEFSMVTRQIDISFPVWLVIFLPYRENPMRHVCQSPVGNPFNLMFDTEMLVVCYELSLLREWYALRDNQTRVASLASWKSGQGLTPRTIRCLYARRNDLYRETMRISVVEESPFIEVKDGVLSHFLGGVIKELSKAMNFRIEVTSLMSTYGSWNEEEEVWTGVIGEVASNRADFGVAEFSMTNHRLDTVDFTLPLILSRNKIYFKKPDGSLVQWSAYFKTFHADIWAAIICLIVSTPIVLTVMKTRGRIATNILADNYIYVWGIYCQQGLSEFPSESSMRLAFLSIFVSALIILSAYSASLISFLTVSTVSLPFSTIEEFAAYGSYKLIVFRNSADYEMIASTRLFSKMKKKQDLPLTVYDGFEQVCNEKVGFYVTEAIKNAMNSVPCETVYIEADRIDSLALVLNKGSPYTGLVNYYLQRLKDNGVLNRLRSKFLVTTGNFESGYTSVTLSGIAPILAVLAGGILLGCFVLMLEKIYYNLWGSKCIEAFQFVSWQKFFERDPGVNPEEKKKRVRNFVKDILRLGESQGSEILGNKGSRTRYQ